MFAVGAAPIDTTAECELIKKILRRAFLSNTLAGNLLGGGEQTAATALSCITAIGLYVIGLQGLTA